MENYKCIRAKVLEIIAVRDISDTFKDHNEDCNEGHMSRTTLLMESNIASIGEELEKMYRPIICKEYTIVVGFKVEKEYIKAQMKYVTFGKKELNAGAVIKVFYNTENYLDVRSESSYEEIVGS